MRSVELRHRRARDRLSRLGADPGAIRARADGRHNRAAPAPRRRVPDGGGRRDPRRAQHHHATGAAAAPPDEPPASFRTGKRVVFRMRSGPRLGKIENLNRPAGSIRASVCMLTNDRIVSLVHRHRGVMAIKWRVLHPERLILATAKAEVTAADLLFCMGGLTEGGVPVYWEIFDFTPLPPVVAPGDVPTLRDADSAPPRP